MRLRLFKSLLSLLFLVTACSQNLYQGFTNLNSDSALYQQALNAINSQSWTTAIKDIQSMSTNGQNSRNVMFTYATALAGQCGFQLLPFFNYLSAAFSGGGGGAPSSLFLSLMQAYQGQTINMLAPGVVNPVNTTDTYCSWSQQIMDNIQTTYGAWTTDEQFFVVNFSLAKIGMILNITAGAGGTLSGGKLIADATFNGCTAGKISDFYVKQITTGLSLFLNNFTTLGIFGSLQTGGNNVTTVWCGTPYQVGPVPQLAMNFCNHVTPAAVTANDLLNVRGILRAWLKEVSEVPPLGHRVAHRVPKNSCAFHQTLL